MQITVTTIIGGFRLTSSRPDGRTVIEAERLPGVAEAMQAAEKLVAIAFGAFGVSASIAVDSELLAAQARRSQLSVGRV